MAEQMVNVRAQKIVNSLACMIYENHRLQPQIATTDFTKVVIYIGSLFDDFSAMYEIKLGFNITMWSAEMYDRQAQDNKPLWKLNGGLGDNNSLNLLFANVNKILYDVDELLRFGSDDDLKLIPGLG